MEENVLMMQTGKFSEIESRNRMLIQVYLKLDVPSINFNVYFEAKTKERAV